MRRISTALALVAAVILSSITIVPFASAVDTSPAPPASELPAVFISGFSLDQSTETDTVLQSNLAMVELYNPTSDVLALEGWRIRGVSADDTLSCVINLSGYLLPKSYGLIAQTPTNDQIVPIDPGCWLEGAAVTTLSLVDPNGAEESTAGVLPGVYVRKNITSSYRGGTFAHDFTTLAASNRQPQSLYYGGWYRPTHETPIRIVEILPHANDCSPENNVMGCQDHVKLHNPTSEPWPLDGLRLRIGYAGQNVTTGNSIVLEGEIPAYGYRTFMTKVNGEPLSIADSGGWVWLEDAYGIGGSLAGTVAAYPSASTKNKTGWAWAYDARDGIWKWTARLSASDEPSVFYLPAEESGRGAIASLTPCRSDQFRNPLTNRCKLRASTASSLTPCRPDQYRSPETNRCRSASSTSSTLTPCKPGQYRSPETNRCRSASTAKSTLVPCKPGQERNSATNRCRGMSSPLSDAAFAVEPIRAGTQNFVGWWALGGIVALGGIYAAWEWRSEIQRAIQKATAFFTSRG